ncbi:proline-rich protein 3 [Carica papaya]|uniref:proline-rich protein 3 n=1 Tax=Carica papaya TaxID=3649 RepID=UPI000B8CA4FD|nr:proline-rich protein 3 [Carica papaya]
MAGKLVMLVAASLVLHCCNYVYAMSLTEPNQVIHVTGKVLCQDCSQSYNEWIHGAKPIKGCRVSLTCMDQRKRVMYYGSDETDEEGQFDLTVDKYTDPNFCFARLLYSPDPTCNVMTNFGGGQYGVKLLRPTAIYRDVINYMIGPFYYTSPMCEKPDITGSD